MEKFRNYIYYNSYLFEINDCKIIRLPVTFSLCIVLLLIACNERNEKVINQEKNYVSKTSHYNQLNIESMRREVINKGDQNIFIELADYYFTGEGADNKKDFLEVCKFMSGKYND